MEKKKSINNGSATAGMPVSELRRDLVTGNWVAIAKSRMERPQPKSVSEADDPIETCPFEDPKKSGNKEPVLLYKDSEDWLLQVIPNKYPAFAGGECGIISKMGPYSVQDGRGFHEVVITRNHYNHIGLLPEERVREILRAYLTRYLALKKEGCVKYISIFHNHGRKSGASLTHPHSQLVAIPIVPSRIRRSLIGSRIFYKKHKKCVHCAMLDWEREDKKRIVLENNDFIAVCPFISRKAYEVRIFPKKHSSHFERIGESKIQALAQLFQEVFARFFRNVNNPPYNFYLHTAPVDSKAYAYYHWHFEVLPKVEVGAGFELGTGIEISTLEPERAAAILRL